jgi:hypothetical protein
MCRECACELPCCEDECLTGWRLRLWIIFHLPTYRKIMRREL